MPKRARARSDHRNPLSSARKDSASSTKDNSDKADRNAQGLWHRKSGAGYHLFLSYYGSQPCGVVAGDGEFINIPERDRSDLRSSASNTGVSLGMSRAAKRRRQKKNAEQRSEGALQEQQKSFEDEIIGNPAVGCKNTGMSSQMQSCDSTHPLVQAFISKSNKYPHLTRFVYALSRPLPLTLRFRDYEQSSAAKVKEHLAKDYAEFIAPVAFDPANSIFQATPKSSLHKSNIGQTCPKLKQLVVDSSINGTIARQELGSMLPVICLRSVRAITAGSKVLDICASPGSKTLQALEIVSGSATQGKRGRVIANDVHSSRLDSLRAAVHRSGLPESLTSRVTYTNYDASTFPAPKSEKLFDAIICDVPCSGDGTIRKDKHILPMWSPNISNSMHGLQLKILRRALELVKVGGVVCFSTCSLNPVEDEAVVAAALRGGTDDALYELLDWPQSSLPGFLRRPGVHTWKVAFYGQDIKGTNDDGDFGSLSYFDSHGNALDAGVKEAGPTLWPNKTENKRVRLDRCTRLFPQDTDSGGFFLALIKRSK
jgi:16S rRNA C967 or C1407 C5-methylase (RsmB/RsmF family)